MIYTFSDPVVAHAVAHANQMRADALRAAFVSVAKIIAARVENLRQNLRLSRAA